MKKASQRFILSMLAIPGALIFGLAGCGSGSGGTKAVATVNGRPVYLSEFKKEIAVRARQNPSFTASKSELLDLLDMIIDKKLIIDEAVREDLARRRRFADTIKTFWEQTLIRDFIDYKNEQIAGEIYITDAELHDYYNRMSLRKTFRVLRFEDKARAEQMMQGEPEAIGWDTTVSFSYEELPSEALARAFLLPVGDMGVFAEGYNYYLVQVAGKEEVEVPPFQEVREKIRRRLLRKKEQDAFSEWLKSKRAGSVVTVHTETLEEVCP